MSSHADEATVKRWFDAFNSRDLEGMLACMHPNVDLHPLHLHGIDGAYEGHAGVREWFASLRRLEHHHRVDIAETSALGDGRVIAAGTLSGGDPAGPASFWALDRLEEGTIVAARHHLSNRFHLR
jgi:ketosteroid isomerase-like protein